MSDWQADRQMIDDEITRGDEPEDFMTWEDFLDTDELDGYERHWNMIDAEVAAETPCPKCGSKCGYIGYKSRNSYRAFSVCQNENCRDFTEF